MHINGLGKRGSKKNKEKMAIYAVTNGPQDFIFVREVVDKKAMGNKVPVISFAWDNLEKLAIG